MIWLLSAFGAPCQLNAAVDAPFTVAAPSDADEVQLLLVLRLTPENAESAVATARVFQKRSLQVGFAIRPEQVEKVPRALLEELVEMGHQPVARLESAEIGVDQVKGPGALRKKLKPLTSVVGKVKAVEAPLGSEQREAVLHRTGLRTVLETNGGATGTPRKQLRFEGQPAFGVVLPAGPYAGDCGRTPVLQNPRPPGLDRITQAVYGARGSTVGIVRGTLIADDESPGLIARWLDEVLLPAGVHVVPPAAARTAALRGLRAGDDGTLPTRTSGGRLIRVDQVQEVARAVAELDSLPRTLPQDLTPSEAFLAFLSLAAGRIEGDVVRLPAVLGPATLNKHLDEAVPIDIEAAQALASSLLDRLPERIPSALPVDGHLLNAPALFTLYASIARGDAAATARPIGVPDPNTPGLGWGDASTP